MTARIAGAAALVVLLSQGCVGIERRAISRATLELPAAVALDQSGEIEVSGVRLGLKSRNDRVTLVLFGPAIVVPLPIIPLPPQILYPPRLEPPFCIDVILDPEGERFTFSPGEVRLYVEGLAELAPTRAKGPAQVESFGPDRAVCGFDPSSDRGGNATIPVTERSCFSLCFEIAPPTPDTKFAILLEGLANDGQPVVVPRIQFTKDSDWSVVGGM